MTYPDRFVRQLEELKKVVSQGATFYVLDADVTNMYCKTQFDNFARTVNVRQMTSTEPEIVEDTATFYGVLGLFCGLIVGIALGESSPKKR